MRRKSERSTTKKAKASPEKKVEKVKRTRTRRRKHSTSSENESTEETSTQDSEIVVEGDKKLPQTPKKADSTEEAQDQVWQVKATEVSGDVGEIQKLKLCLARPPTTPERVDRSPRSKRKHSRATSSSDTPSVEAVDDRKKTRHRSKRGTRESKDESEKNHDSQEELEVEPEPESDAQSKNDTESETSKVTQSNENVKESVPDEVPVSTTNEDNKEQDEAEVKTTSEKQESTESESKAVTEQSKSPDADTTVVSPRGESTAVSQSSETTIVSPEDEAVVVSTKADIVQCQENVSPEKSTPPHDHSELVDKSEVLEIHADDSKFEGSDNDTTMKETPQEQPTSAAAEKDTTEDEVSKIEEKSDKVSKDKKSSQQGDNKTTNKNDVVESSHKTEAEAVRNSSDVETTPKAMEKPKREFERSNSAQSAQENVTQNGSSGPIVISRKRRWGSRPTKISTQKSITISTDVLKEIIPDVKPVEFEEVIEEKKPHKREISEKVERPILPKIVIDNTENMHQYRKEKDHEDNEKEITKVKESHLAANRKISIVKDNESIIARPPSPPRHKQSCILYITNLVRPFTLPQLKNLLQRTGRIEENGFWIDRIKSKCYVKYETEDQAVETRHALHGVTWPVSNPKTLQVDFSTQEAFDKAKTNEESDNAQTSTIPGTVEDWLREQDLKRERGELDKPWERKAAMREWDVGKGEKEKDKDKLRREERPQEKRRHRTPERSPEPARKFKKKEEEAPAKLLDDLFRKTKTTPCIYWLPLSAETIAIKEEQRRQHMAEHERRLQELRRTHRRH